MEPRYLKDFIPIFFEYFLYGLIFPQNAFYLDEILHQCWVKESVAVVNFLDRGISPGWLQLTECNLGIKLVKWPLLTYRTVLNEATLARGSVLSFMLSRSALDLAVC